jgi:hypothetical protein
MLILQAVILGIIQGLYLVSLGPRDPSGRRRPG